MSKDNQLYVWKGTNDLALTRWPIDGCVKQMSLGLYHSAFLTYDGQVFCCGQNSHGQLGLGNDEGSYRQPERVACLDHEVVTCVGVGLYHTVCGTVGGNVYCWGDSTHSQCGSSEPTHYATPQCLASFNCPVKKVDCCATSSVVLLADGRLLAWGSGVILRYTVDQKPKVLEPSPFPFIEDRHVLDVSCGSNFVVAVLKKTTVTRKTLLSKNSFVIVHKSDSELEAFNSEEFTKELGDRSHCPLGLEVREEHVLLPSSGKNSPASLRKFGDRQPRTTSASSKLSHSSSQELPDDVEDSEGTEEADKSADTSLSSALQQPVINVNQNEAEQWFKDKMGSRFSRRENELASPGSDSSVPGEATPTAPLSVRDRLPPYVESMWQSITTSSQVVTTAVQTHVVPKIPLLDKLSLVTDESSSGMGESMGLVPMMALPINPTTNGAHTVGDKHPSPSAKGVASLLSRVLKHGESSSPLSSRASSKSALPTGSHEYHQEASISTEVWSWGAGVYGQLGHADCLDRLQPCVVSSLTDSQVYRVECSDHSCMALTTNGKVYGWGDNQHGQIIYKDKPMVLQPTLISISTKIPVIDFSLGVDHALLEVISPANTRAKSGIFHMGEASQNPLGARLEFTKKLGCKRSFSAGPNGISSICGLTKSPAGYGELCELRASELQLYRVLLDIMAHLVEPILESDFMAGLLDSPYGECLKNMVEQLFLLVDKIGVNTQELCAVTSPDDLLTTSVVGDHQHYLTAFSTYATHFHNFLAMNGMTYLVDTVKIVLLNNEEAITDLLERCQLEFSDEMVVKVSILLQLPLRRVSEYHELIESVHLNLEDGSMFVPCLTALEQERLHLSSQYNLAESTRIFWDQCSKAISNALKEPHRRLVRESKSLTLNLVNASKLSKNMLLLFNDVFVHIQGNVHKVYPLEKLWIETRAGEETSREHEIKLIMPEATLHVQASNSAEKGEWVWMLNQTVSAWLASYKQAPSGGSSLARKAPQLRTAPAIRVASHMFYKAGPLQGAVYKGKWYKGLMHGEGHMTWADGRVYTGQFANGEITGYGRLTYKKDAEVESMKGYWCKGKLHGFAKTKFVNGDSYTGFYRDNQFHGHGVLKQRATSSVYVGEWKNGRRQGYGVLDSKGEKYLGEWVKDVKQGPGLHITLDGYYMEGNFTNNKLIGQGLIMSSDDTYYEGTFTGLGEVNGKGVMVMNNGDSITGAFEGSWAGGIKVNGQYKKATSNEVTAPHSSLPEHFGALSTPHDLKWTELFSHSRVALGCTGTGEVNCEKAWEKVAILFANLQNQGFSARRKSFSEQLEKIPPHNMGCLSLQQLRAIRRYLHKACDCDLHPLGLLLQNLVDVYRMSYSGTGTHRRLLRHARDELLSITHRYYQIIRILFPELPEDGLAKRVMADTGEGANSDVQSEDLTVQMDDQPCDLNMSQVRSQASDIITPTLLIFPLLLPKIYEPLFHLYALQSEAEDERYWCRVKRFNKQTDVTLLSYLGIPEKFWLLEDANSADNSLKSLEVRDGCYIDAIEALQRLSTCFTPAEKLQTLQLTFNKINQAVKESVGDNFLWSMDELFPVFLFVVIRARLRYLGSEIQLMDDLMDSHLEYGELGLMFTTLKACHLQIQTEKLL